MRDKSDPIEHAKKLLEAQGVTEDELKDARQGDPQDRQRSRRFRRADRPSRMPAELYTDVLVETY